MAPSMAMAKALGMSSTMRAKSTLGDGKSGQALRNTAKSAGDRGDAFEVSERLHRRCNDQRQQRPGNHAHDRGTLDVSAAISSARTPMAVVAICQCGNT